MARARRNYGNRTWNTVKNNPMLTVGLLLGGSALTLWGMMPKSVTTQLSGLNPKKKSGSEV